MPRSEMQWTVRASSAALHANAVTRLIADALDLTPVTAQLLVNRGYDTPQDARDFLAKRTELFHDPFVMKDLRTAAERLLAAVEEKKKIVIFGDYDVDGVTSVSCLYLYLASLGASPEYFIPSRLGDGYGMSDGAIRRLAGEGAEVIVTVDTGITALHEAQTARELGLELIITSSNSNTSPSFS